MLLTSCPKGQNSCYIQNRDIEHRRKRKQKKKGRKEEEERKKREGKQTDEQTDEQTNKWNRGKRSGGSKDPPPPGKVNIYI